MRDLSNPKRERGFFAIGIGIGLLAIFGGISLGIKHAAEAEQAAIATPAQHAAAQAKLSAHVAVADGTPSE